MLALLSSARAFGCLRLRLGEVSRRVLLGCLTGVLAAVPGHAFQSVTALPAPTIDTQQTPGDGSQTAVLAGGCFWGVQAVFAHVKGVHQVVSGYAGGPPASAHYEAVSSGRTGHAESVRIIFDPHEISYGKILQVFFSVAHDATELDRQGPDVGTQYRSAIFYQGESQQRVAEAYIAQLGTSGAFKRPIVTRIDPLVGFYPAETYHQDYAIHHPNDPYIAYNDLPKVENLKRVFPDLWRDLPVMVAADAATR
jgi:peptide-methionine (S)-S-oxide reductase